MPSLLPAPFVVTVAVQRSFACSSIAPTPTSKISNSNVAWPGAVLPPSVTVLVKGISYVVVGTVSVGPSSGSPSGSSASAMMGSRVSTITRQSRIPKNLLIVFFLFVFILRHLLLSNCCLLIRQGTPAERRLLLPQHHRAPATLPRRQCIDPDPRRSGSSGRTPVCRRQDIG